MDFEFSRLETYKLSLMHFVNANMYLHGQALELYSETYDALRQINFEIAFPDADKNHLKDIIKAN